MPLVAAHLHGRRRPGGFRIRLRQLVTLLEAVVCIAGMAIFAYFVYHFALSADFSRVEHIVVYGASAVTPAEVRVASGVTKKHSLLFLDKAAVAQRIGEIPYVASVEVQRELPDTLVIHLTEREAAATLLAGRRSFLIDKEGVVLKECDPGDPVVGPLITNVPSLGVVTAGGRLEHPAVLEALKLWEVFSAIPLADEVNLSEISAESPVNLAMFWDEVPYEVRWGRSDYAKQAERLTILWREKAGQLPCQEYLDLRFDQDLVCR